MMKKIFKNKDKKRRQEKRQKILQATSDENYTQHIYNLFRSLGGCALLSFSHFIQFFILLFRFPFTLDISCFGVRPWSVAFFWRQFYSCQMHKFIANINWLVLFVPYPLAPFLHWDIISVELCTILCIEHLPLSFFVTLLRSLVRKNKKTFCCFLSFWILWFCWLFVFVLFIVVDGGRQKTTSIGKWFDFYSHQRPSNFYLMRKSE